MSSLPIRIERRLSPTSRIELGVEGDVIALAVASLGGGTVLLSPAEARWLSTALNGMAERAASPPEGA